MRYREISYHADTDGLGYEAIVYERTEPSKIPRYNAQRRQWTDKKRHVSTLRTESLERATEYAQQWTGARPIVCEDQSSFY